MSDYSTPEERAALENELDDLPVEEVEISSVHPRISVRLSGDELETIERAANAAGMKLSTFIREAALAAATAAGAVAERRQLEQRLRTIRDLVSALESDVHNRRYATSADEPRLRTTCNGS